MGKKKKGLTKQQKQFFDILRNSAMNVTAACEKMGISRRTFYNWKNDNETFRETYEDVREEMVDFAETKLMSNIREGKETSIIFFLKTQGKDRGYVEKQEFEDTSKAKFIEVMKEASKLRKKQLEGGLNDD